MGKEGAPSKEITPSRNLVLEGVISLEGASVLPDEWYLMAVVFSKAPGVRGFPYFCVL
jgi:hypothetical protein